MRRRQYPLARPAANTRLVSSATVFPFPHANSPSNRPGSSTVGHSANFAVYPQHPQQTFFLHPFSFHPYPSRPTWTPSLPLVPPPNSSTSFAYSSHFNHPAPHPQRQQLIPMEEQPPPQQSNGAAPPPAHTGGKRVYVGNLSWDTRWQSLKDHMREAGDVVHAEVFTEASGRSAGCGIVEFETPEGAENAISTLNDTVLDGRTIFVRADREEGKPRQGRYGDGEGGYRGHRPSDRGRKIVVWNLPYHIRWQDLKDLFRDYGNVIRADIPQTPDGKSKGMGTVLFETEMEADRAITEMTGKEVDGRVVDCRLDKFA